MLDQFSKEEDSIAHGEKVELKVALFCIQYIPYELSTKILRYVCQMKEKGVRH